MAIDWLVKRHDLKTFPRLESAYIGRYQRGAETEQTIENEKLLLKLLYPSDKVHQM